jgi:nucleoid DNA-binding protein
MSTKSPTAPKASRPVTLKHLAAALAEQHQLTKRAGEALLGDLVGKITKHLKKGERVRIAGLVSYRSENAPPAWVGILQREKQSRLRPARKSPSGQLRI